MRINAFVTFDPIFQELNGVLEHPSVANIIEDQTDSLYSFPLENINVISGKIYAPAIQEGQLVSITNTLFDVTGKDEINYGVRIIGNRLTPNSRIIEAFKDQFPSGSRLFLIKKEDMSGVIQHYVNEYTALTGSTNRKDIAKRRRLYCEPHETLTSQQIEDAMYETLNFVDTYFSSISASINDNFDQTAYLTGTTTQTTTLKARVYTAP
jgi:hypothetical protein